LEITVYRLLGDNHVLDGLPFTTQVFLRALDGIRSGLAQDAGVTGTELRALSRVAEDTGLGSVALGESLELPTGVVETLVDGLQARGLLSATSDPSAPAASTLKLTPAGHALIAATYESFQHTITAAAESLGAEREVIFESGMLKMARKLDDVVEKRAAGRR
jgi:DNA-binding MarR family transcriptional regulator